MQRLAWNLALCHSNTLRQVFNYEYSAKLQVNKWLQKLLKVTQFQQGSSHVVNLLYLTANRKRGKGTVTRCNLYPLENVSCRSDALILVIWYHCGLESSAIMMLQNDTWAQLCRIKFKAQVVFPLQRKNCLCKTTRHFCKQHGICMKTPIRKLLYSFLQGQTAVLRECNSIMSMAQCKPAVTPVH